MMRFLRPALAPVHGLVLGCAFAALLATALPAHAAAAASWPSVALPSGATAYQVGEQMSVDGFPMRLQGFVTRSAPLETAAWFRNKLGQPLVENHLLGKLVLGRAQGDYYVSVLLEALPGESGGTRGTVTVSNLASAYEKREATRVLNERMLARLPNGSRLINQLSSTERGRATAYVLAENGHSQQLNRDQLVRRLEAEGYLLEREAMPDAKQARALPAQMAAGRTLFFKGKDKEAMAVIRPAEEAGSTIVIQTVNLVQELK
jgi:hypothetical protein